MSHTANIESAQEANLRRLFRAIYDVLNPQPPLLDNDNVAIGARNEIDSRNLAVRGQGMAAMYANRAGSSRWVGRRRRWQALEAHGFIYSYPKFLATGEGFVTCEEVIRRDCRIVRMRFIPSEVSAFLSENQKPTA